VFRHEMNRIEGTAAQFAATMRHFDSLGAQGWTLFDFHAMNAARQLQHAA
jgi:hypothetical protein